MEKYTSHIPELYLADAQQRANGRGNAELRKYAISGEPTPPFPNLGREQTQKNWQESSNDDDARVSQGNDVEAA